MLQLDKLKFNIIKRFWQDMKLKLNLRAVLILISVLIAQFVYAKELKIIQVTDSHFSSTGIESSQRDVENSKSVLEKTINDINSVSKVDFVVFTGDNIDQANIIELKRFLMIANKLKYPYYVVIGNHEVFKSQDLTKKEYMKIVRKYSKNCRPEGANYVFEKQGIVFLVVDGAKEVIPGPAGYYRQDTLRWLDKKLIKYKNSKVIIFQHFPIEEPYYNRTHATYNKEDYKNILKKHKNVIAIISGHYHANGEKMVDGIYHISTPSLLEAPHNYKIIEVSGNDRKGYNIFTQLRHAE